MGRVWCLVIALGAIEWGWAGRARATVLEPGFIETQLAPPWPLLHPATGLAWAPDGSNRLFVAVQNGNIRVFKDGVLLDRPFATISPVRQGGETGLLGIAMDPDFLSTRHVYAFVTVSTSEQQIIRYTAQGDEGVEKTTIVAGLPTNGDRHSGGAIGMGLADGKLYWAVGDMVTGVGVNEDLASLASKVGRANLDGSAPADNPFFDGPAGPNADHIWARGFRNPFTITFQPATGLLWVNDVGAFWERIFIVRRGEHGGWNAHENRQPAGFISPVIKYPTNSHQEHVVAPAAMSGAVRSGGRLTVTLTAMHDLLLGEKVQLSRMDDASFNGAGYVSAVPSRTSFTIGQAGPDAVSGGGTMSTTAYGGCVTGGAFYDSTAFPPAYRGNFFFAEYNTDRIVRAAIDPATNNVVSVDFWATGIRTPTDVALGPDGDLYYVGTHNGAVVRAASTEPTTQGLVVTPTNLWMAEGQAAVVNVRLAMTPAAPITVTGARLDGDSEVVVAPATGALTFDATNWRKPRTLTVVAGRDLDATNDTATVAISAPGVPVERVTVRVRDDNQMALVVTPAAVAMDEGQTAMVTVALSRRPSVDVVAGVARVDGDADVSVATGASLTFTSANWSMPQTVTLTAAQDADGGEDRAMLAVTSPGLEPRPVAVTVRDDDARAPMIVSMPVMMAVAGVAYRYDVEATGLPPPAFSLENPAAGMSIDRDSGSITWTPAAAGSFMVAVRASNGVAPDATQRFVLEVSGDRPPDCTLSRPRAGEVVSGTMAAFSGEGTDDVGVAKGEFRVDGAPSYTHVTTSGRFHHGGAPMLWDTTTLADGPHTATLVVFDSAGQTCAAETTVVVANGTPGRDGGTDAAAAGHDASSGADAPVVRPPPTGGCECRTDGGGRPGPGSGALALAAFALILRRRRRACSLTPRGSNRA